MVIIILLMAGPLVVVVAEHLELTPTNLDQAVLNLLVGQGAEEMPEPRFKVDRAEMALTVSVGQVGVVDITAVQVVVVILKLQLQVLVVVDL